MMRLIALAIVVAVAAAALFFSRAPERQNAGLPVVHAAMPKHGFVCVPAITPHTGPVRSREIV